MIKRRAASLLAWTALVMTTATFVVVQGSETYSVVCDLELDFDNSTGVDCDRDFAPDELVCIVSTFAHYYNELQSNPYDENSPQILDVIMYPDDDDTSAARRIQERPDKEDGRRERRLGRRKRSTSTYYLQTCGSMCEDPDAHLTSDAMRRGLRQVRRRASTSQWFDDFCQEIKTCGSTDPAYAQSDIMSALVACRSDCDAPEKLPVAQWVHEHYEKDEFQETKAEIQGDLKDGGTAASTTPTPPLDSASLTLSGPQMSSAYDGGSAATTTSPEPQAQQTTTTSSSTQAQQTTTTSSTSTSTSTVPQAQQGGDSGSDDRRFLEVRGRALFTETLDDEPTMGAHDLPPRRRRSLYYDQDGHDHSDHVDYRWSWWTSSGTYRQTSTPPAAALPVYFFEGRDGHGCRPSMEDDDGRSRYLDTEEQRFVVAPLDRVSSLESCQDYCLQWEKCQGVDYGVGDCRLWTVPVGNIVEEPGRSCYLKEKRAILLWGKEWPEDDPDEMSRGGDRWAQLRKWYNDGQIGGFKAGKWQYISEALMEHRTTHSWQDLHYEQG